MQGYWMRHGAQTIHYLYLQPVCLRSNNKNHRLSCIGDNKLILMTNTFDIVSENSLERENFGEGNVLSCTSTCKQVFITQNALDAPINVGL